MKGRMMVTAGVAATAALLSGTASADGLLTLKSENDLFASGGDGHYTNGLEIGWSFAPSAGHWTRQLADALPGWSGATLDGAAYRFGQQIYTPEDIDQRGLVEDDRPYAGVLYAGLSLFDESRTPGWRRSSGLFFDVGLVGPGSGARTVQKNFHHWIGSDEPEGWHNQLHNEPFVNVAYSTAWWKTGHLGGLETEFGPSVGFAVGNLYTYAASGLGLRLGQGLDQSFGVPAVAPSQGSRVYFREDSGFNWYLFANLEGRLMAHNMLLDGNTFEDSHSVDRRPWVGDAQVGLALSWNRWQLSYSSVWRTKEFDEQDSGDRFGSVTLSTWL
ncbi:lipid A deacylase LpxR family protein [Salinicola endophyticus]|uniref:Lipid A deacylase LpxR family protein n=1 Tax=Salinicola endophyticus TaxID=1949083 RepID=A0ABY8FRD5_9GAMM|nr:lipid A deacylase LpxR family protein [Salinicola endophyticus]WFF42444.1 lipid A deacylase LpxR family protein [Salinicola endophyticus]